MHLRRAVVGTRRKVHDFLLRLFRFDVGKKGSRHRFRWSSGSGRCGGNLRLCFLLPGVFTWYFRRDRRNRSVFLFLIMLPCQLPKFLPALRRESHHHLVEAVDGRIGFPVQLCIDVVRVGRLGGTVRFRLFVFRNILRGGSRRHSRNILCGLHLRLGRNAPCRAFLFRRFFLFGGFRLADLFRHAPEVEQRELHSGGIFRTRFYLRLFLCGLRFLRRSFHRLCRRYRFQFYGRTLHFLLYGNPLFRSRLPDCSRIQAHGEPVMEILVKHTAQVPGYACGLALVQIDHSGFPVGVCVKFRRRMHDAFRVVDEIGVVGQVGFRVRLYHGHQPLVLRHFLLAEVLLQDNQVTAHFCPRVVREQVVGQAYRRYQISLTEQLVTHGGLAAVQYPLRGDERHDTAVTHGIQSFEKEIVVDGFLCRSSAEGPTLFKFRVEHGNVTERNVGHRQVEIIVERSFDFLKTAGARFLVGIEMPQDCTREQILLESHHVRTGAVP
ncbi:Uncharacterised protein [Phocaeicola vulgatus]|nr:Uncharacterised protein [Phocaeicola vulgatus]